MVATSRAGGVGQRCMARGWLMEQMGQTGSAEGHLGATWP